jgi:hypothetical protein
MDSMTQNSTPLVIGGVHAHPDAHYLESFPTTTPGYAEALDWLSRYGQIDAVESTGCYAAAFVRYLREHEIRVVEVNQPTSWPIARRCAAKLRSARDFGSLPAT